MPFELPQGHKAVSLDRQAAKGKRFVKNFISLRSVTENVSVFGCVCFY